MNMKPGMDYFSRMLGVPIAHIMADFDKHDCLTMDTTGAGPLLRKNWFETIG